MADPLDSAVSEPGEVAKWVTEIKLYEREAQPWEERSKKIIKRFKDERGANDKRFRFNILWSNIQTLGPALFAKNPKPNVERRFQDDDDVGRLASEAIERGCSYFVDDKFFDGMRQVVLDRLLPGRGTMWFRYVPQFSHAPEISDDEDAQEEAQELYSEEVVADYVHWRDFGCTWARTWEEVRAAWRRVYMDRAELIKRFGEEIGKAIPLDHSPEKLNDEKISEAQKKASIYEIWDKTTKKAMWLHKDYPRLLDSVDDPLKLKEFFPFPRPLFATLANDSIIPVPDYAEYQDQAQELDDITARINSITKSVKVAGVYDASAEGVQRLLTEGVDNRLIPVSSWATMAEKGGLKGVVDFMPLIDIIKALEALYAAREKVKQDLYEITGLSDILRGQGDPNETATGVKAKGQFATLRLNSMQGDVARFCRDAVRIIGEIICTHFSMETIVNISGIKLLTQQQKQIAQQFMAMQQQQPAQPGQQPAPQMPPPPELADLMKDQEKFAEMMDEPTWEEVHALMTNDTMRCFRIDIEVDSTIKADQEEEKQSRLEFLQAAGGFLQQAMTIPNPELMPLLMEMFMFGVRGFHVGKDLEGAFKVAMKKVQDHADNPPQQPANPELEKVQAEGQIQAQLEQMKHQNQLQAMQGDIQLEQAKAQKAAEVEQMRLQHDQQLEAMKLQHERELHDQKIGLEQTKLMIQRDIEHEKIKSSERQARVSAKSKDASLEADAQGLAPLEEEPNRFDQISQGQEQMGQATLQALAQQQQAMEQQMEALLEIAQMSKQSLQGIQHAIEAVTAEKEVVRDPETGRVTGSRIKQQATVQ